MSEHVGYVVAVTELRAHSNADRLQIATFFGNDTIVGLDVKAGDIGIYFPVDLQLSEEYCRENDLVRRKDENGKDCGGYLDPVKRNIKALRLRGEKSDGLFMPLSSLDYIYKDKKIALAKFAGFQVGDRIDVVLGHEICCKYIPRDTKNTGNQPAGNRTRKKRVPLAPLFQEHADTEQLAYNLAAFRPGDLIEITLKMHGTSQRTGYLPVLKGYTHTNPLYNHILKADPNKLGKIAKKLFDKALATATPVYDWGYVTGTRRVVLEGSMDGGWYGSNEFRCIHAQALEGKLLKGETVYYEVVGFTDDKTPIMSEVPNSRISDKDFSKQYGKTTTFSYGCDRDGVNAPQSDFYVYRMTMTNEDGDVVEYTPDFMRYRCEQMGVKCVPMFWKGYIPNQAFFDSWHDDGSYKNAGEWVKDAAECYYDGPDPVGKTHVREGVVVRIVNRPKFTAYKHKNFSFKVLEGIAKDEAAAPDMEEVQDIESE